MMEYRDRQEIPKALTLYEFSRFVAQALSREPVLLGTWVTAEISDLSTSGGHCYMNLIEKDKAGVTIARMRATIWASSYYRIKEKFLKATNQHLVNGLKVMLYGGINFHSSYGLSFNVGDIDPSYTMGDLERLRREILEALRKEGVLECNRRLRISEPPLRIAIISSGTAAGYGDFINQLYGNPLGVQFNTMLFGAAMQGEKTAPSVLNALDLVEQTHRIARWDCVVIIRGGGATTDMNWFDNLELARRVATFSIPVVVGIGHERDRCVLDEIACVRCKTPTAVAAWLIDTVASQWQRAADLANRVATFAMERLRGEHIRLQSLETMLPAAAEARLSNARLRLQSISAHLPLIAQGVISKENGRLNNLTTTLRMTSRSLMDKENIKIDSLAAELRRASAVFIDRKKQELENIERLIQVLSPESTLRRGYTITRINGKSVTNIKEASEGAILETQTAYGRILSKVEKTS